MRRILLIFTLAIIIVLSTGLSYFSLTNGDWWGDFAGYFIQAKGILADDPQVAVDGLSRINARSPSPPGPDAYPWGYPLLVAGVASRYGFAPVPIKLINVLFYALFLLILYLYARRKTPAVIALAITSAFAFSPISLSLIDHMRSDVVFMAVSFAAFLTFESLQGRRSWLGWIGLGGLIFLASALRTVGALILILPLIYVIGSPKTESKQRSLAAAATFGAFICCSIFYRAILPSGENSYFSHLEAFTIGGFAKSVALNFVIPKMFVAELPLPWLWYILLLVAFVIGVIKTWRAEVALLTYLGAMIAILVIWPEPQGYRFYAPLMPLIVIIASIGALSIPALFKSSKPPQPSRLSIILVLLFFGAQLTFTVPEVVSTARLTMSKQRAITGPFDKHSRAVYKAIRKLVPADGWVYFTKPRSILLFTDRLAFDDGGCEDIGADGFALFTDQLAEQSNFSVEEFLACEQFSKTLVYQNPRFELYEYHAEQY